jgi:endonuclease/exonuclease/phosphatase family metal-dependent hydrolase
MQRDADLLRLMTWNLWWKFGSWEERLNAIIKTLQDVSPDIVLLQEVWQDADGRSEAEELANALGYSCTYKAATSIDSVNLGNAILSRWPFTTTGSLPLPVSENAPEARCAVFAEVDSPHGPLFVTTSHLTWQRNNSAGRQAQLRVILDLIKEKAVGDWPPILGGDFNADPDSDEIRMLTGKSALADDSLVFQDAWDQGGDGTAGITWTPNSQHYPDSRYREVTAMPWLKRRLDYLFVGLPDGRPTNIKAIQVERTWLVGNDGCNEGSDHYAVVADLHPHRLDE